ncbi:hypothetical protein L3Q65_24390 [Amycolatopsis sp. FU40]|uniref:inositol monophosphatase family protein n=1 Tax=Amycolatopsis sp. FU40 TaxID=2914159 RepID=UPI001F34F48D|nr:inositol monophosphatase family protein [Amycolatopsis sp. FU40]UKD51071.1 hypothetical protein L3Q65_24390 [Amycolatopsis sp. FU40]
MKNLIVGLAQAIRTEVLARRPVGAGRSVLHDSPGGDAQFDIDEVAEEAIWRYLKSECGDPIAVYTEDHGLRNLGRNPRHLLVIDPIDGTRPASAGLEMANVSIASAPMSEDPIMSDVDHALLMELSTGRWMYADANSPELTTEGYIQQIPCLSANDDLARMFWSIEFNGHPMHLMNTAYGHLVNQSANTGGVFVFNSASFSISRLITGQLDAYVDIGNRILRDRPETREEFLAAGRGNILHLFPYDIAASVLLAERSGVTITDAYGEPLGKTRLLDLAPTNQQSCIAAANPRLHERLLDSIEWSSDDNGIVR